jgi:cytochrome P450
MTVGCAALMSFYVELPPVPLPGPRALPVLGARGNLVRFLGDPVTAMLRLNERYGEVVPLARDNPGWVLAFGPEHNRRVLSDPARFHNFADNPMKVPPGCAAAKFTVNLINQNGELHRRARRTMMPAFSKARLAGYAEMMAATVEPLLARREIGEVVDARALATDLSLAVALRCLFNVDLSSGADELGALVLDYLERVFSPANVLLPLKVPGTPYARFMETCERLGGRVEGLIAERRQHGTGDDILSALIEAYAAEGDQRPQQEIDDELLGQTAMLLVAGHETTANTLAWTLFLLTQHPDIAAALIDEVTAADLGDPLALDTVMGLPLLGRVLAESMRLLPAVPLLFFRRSTEPFVLGSHELPVGATVVLSPLVTHRCPELYPEPRRFNPDRWLEFKPSAYEYLPFGAGPRMCLGAGFGTQILRLLMVMILRRFGVALSEGARVSYKTGGVTMGPKRGIALRLTEPGQAPAPVRARGNIHELVELPG